MVPEYETYMNDAKKNNTITNVKVILFSKGVIPKAPFKQENPTEKNYLISSGFSILGHSF
jgi:hypothetical protein